MFSRIIDVVYDQFSRLPGRPTPSTPMPPAGQERDKLFEGKQIQIIEITRKLGSLACVGEGRSEGLPSVVIVLEHRSDLALRDRKEIRKIAAPFSVRFIVTGPSEACARA